MAVPLFHGIRISGKSGRQKVVLSELGVVKNKKGSIFASRFCRPLISVFRRMLRSGGTGAECLWQPLVFQTHDDTTGIDSGADTGRADHG